MPQPNIDDLAAVLDRSDGECKTRPERARRLVCVRNRYEVVGSLERARSFNDMLDIITESTENPA